MKKIMLVLAMLVALVSNVFAQDIKLTKAEKEVWEASNSLASKMKAGDTESVLALVHTDCIYSLAFTDDLLHKNDFADWINTLKPGEYSLRETLLETKVHGDVAIVSKIAESPNGDTNIAMVTWKKQGGKWSVIGYMERATEKRIPFETLDVYTLVKVDESNIPGTVSHGGHDIMLYSGTFIIAADNRCISVSRQQKWHSLSV